VRAFTEAGGPARWAHLSLDPAKNEDREIDAFAKIEIPPHGAEPAGGDRAAPDCLASTYRDARGGASQRKINTIADPVGQTSYREARRRSARRVSHPRYPGAERLTAQVLLAPGSTGSRSGQTCL